jgi:NAD(P)-dependent dehydrogenase (short-subunit alcohol dehydrogenase family)
MKIQDAVALVIGANRGLGLAFTRARVDELSQRVKQGLAADPAIYAVPR